MQFEAIAICALQGKGPISEAFISPSEKDL